MHYQPKLVPTCLLALLFDSLAIYSLIVDIGSKGLLYEMLLYIIYAAGALFLGLAVWAIIGACHTQNPIEQLGALAAKSELTNRYFQDSSFRVVTGAYLSFGISVGVAMMRGWMGIRLQSSWFGMLAGYYMVLCWVHFILIKSSQKITLIQEEKLALMNEWRVYKKVGVMLMLTTIFLGAAIVHMVGSNKSYRYDGLLILAVAAHDLRAPTSTIIYMAWSAHHHRPIVIAIKMICY